VLKHAAAPDGAALVVVVKIDVAASASDTRSTSFGRRTRYICGFVLADRSKIKLLLDLATSRQISLMEIMGDVLWCTGDV